MPFLTFFKKSSFFRIFRKMAKNGILGPGGVNFKFGGEGGGVPPGDPKNPKNLQKTLPSGAVVYYPLNFTSFILF